MNPGRLSSILKCDNKISANINGKKEPYNQGIERTARGRHGACLRKLRAGDTTGLSLPGQCPPSVLAVHPRVMNCLRRQAPIDIFSSNSSSLLIIAAACRNSFAATAISATFAGFPFLRRRS